MQERKFEELEDRASFFEKADDLKQLEARTRVHKEIEAMKAEGKALELSEEEENMLRSFRRFKLRMRKRVETFTWQTRVGDDVVLVKETGNIVHPNEVGSQVYSSRHLCLAADRGLSQREALEEMKGAASQPEAGKERSEVR